MSAPGFGFKDRKLYVFAEDRILLLKAWPTLKAVQKTGNSPWMDFAPRFRLLFDETQGPGELFDDPLPTGEGFLWQRRRAFDAFRASIPVHVATAVEKYQTRQWKLLQLMQKSPVTVELAGINPALCFALASYKVFRKRFCTMEGATIVSKRRQRDIAEWVGFPGTDAVARVLAKVPPESVSVDLLKSLSAMIREPEKLKILAHLSKLNAGVLGILSADRLSAAIKPTLLSEISCCPEEDLHPQAADMLTHLLEMKRTVTPDTLPPRVNSLAQLRTLHDMVLAEFLLIDQRQGGALPKPPIPGTAKIVPLLTGDDLREEGMAQNNCVGGYSYKIRKGKTFIYRVLEPERATLEINMNSEGDWLIGQLKCYSNSEPSAATRQSVESWIDQYALTVEK
jgi:hypothetical protein